MKSYNNYARGMPLDSDLSPRHLQIGYLPVHKKIIPVRAFDQSVLYPDYEFNKPIGVRRRLFDYVNVG